MLYPSNIKKKYKSFSLHKNRGMALEAMLNESNRYYLINNIAVIYKKPTPIGVVKVKYHNKKKIIDKGYFESPSTLDYNGLYRGKYIDFEAKETKNKTSFPLSNIHPHQIQHIRRVLEHQGIVFIIIKINSFIYLIRGEDFIDFIDTNTRKSIPYDYIKEKGFLLKERLNPTIDYLKIIDKLYFKGEWTYGN